METFIGSPLHTVMLGWLQNYMAEGEIGPALLPPVSRIEKWMENRLQYQCMANSKGELCLKRWVMDGNCYTLESSIVLNKWIGKSEGMHDHTFDFVSLVLRGELHEQKFNEQGKMISENYYPAGSIRFTSYADIHLIHGEPEALTLVLSSAPRQPDQSVFENGERKELHQFREQRNSYYVYS